MNVLQLQAKAERQAIVSYEPDFRLDVDAIDAAVAGGDGLAAMLSPQTPLEPLATAAARLTRQRFGHTMRMFAPLYLSNECVSECTYCGFQVFNRDVVRRTLTVDEVAREARYLRSLGFRHLLLVAGEHPKHVSVGYIGECVRACASVVPSVSVEVQVFDEDTYRGFVREGADGVVVYQECYDERLYGRFHLKGNKRFWAWRLGAPERAAAAGMRRIGLGTLIGLNPDWRWEVLALAAHARWMMRRAWRAEITVALPRLEPAAGFETPPHVMTDEDLVRAVCALRLTLPDAGIVLSTREPAWLRDGLAPLGVTHMSAGSRTEPGGYSEPGQAQEQFRISDERCPADVASMLRRIGLDPVWKDWSEGMRPA